MPLNDGYAYRERLTDRALGRAPVRVLEYFTRRYRHSREDVWRARLAAGEVFLEGAVATGTELLRPGQELVWHRPPWMEDEVPLDYRVLHEDRQLLAVFKPSGLPTLPGGGFLTQTLLHQVRATYPDASPLHRLGRGTSGIVLFALDPATSAALSRDWREHEVHKTYRALASGHPEQAHYEIRTPIGPVDHPRLGKVFAANPHGLPSSSDATLLEQRADSALFSVDIHSGRPHQIRIHLASIGHPLVGDPLYGTDGLPLPLLPGLPGDGGYLLHAERLAVRHPLDGRILTLVAPPPFALLTRQEGGPG